MYLMLRGWRPFASTCSDGSDIILHPVAMRLFLDILDRLKIDESIPLDNLRYFCASQSSSHQYWFTKKKLIVYTCDVFLRESIFENIDRTHYTYMYNAWGVGYNFLRFDKTCKRQGRTIFIGVERGRDIYSRQDKKILDIFVRCIKYSDIFDQRYSPVSSSLRVYFEKKNIYILKRSRDTPLDDRAISLRIRAHQEGGLSSPRLG